MKSDLTAKNAKDAKTRKKKENSLKPGLPLGDLGVLGGKKLKRMKS
jgi:hypothetical protein